MSVQALGWVLDHSQSEGNARLILIAIANHANHDGTNAFPSVDAIAKEARVHRATVFRLLPKLVELGELEVTHGGTGRGHPNFYRLTFQTRKGSQEGSQIATVNNDFRVASNEKKGRTVATQTVIPRTEIHAGARAYTRVGERPPPARPSEQNSDLTHSEQKGPPAEYRSLVAAMRAEQAKHRNACIAIPDKPPPTKGAP